MGALTLHAPLPCSMPPLSFSTANSVSHSQMCSVGSPPASTSHNSPQLSEPCPCASRLSPPSLQRPPQRQRPLSQPNSQRRRMRRSQSLMMMRMTSLLPPQSSSVSTHSTVCQSPPWSSTSSSANTPTTKPQFSSTGCQRTLTVKATAGTSPSTNTLTTLTSSSTLTTC